VLTFSGWQWAAAITALQLPELALILPKSYLISRPMFYGLISLGIAAGLYFGRPWAPRAAQWISLAMILWSLIERGILSTNEYAARTLLGTAFITLLLWSVLFITLRRPKVHKYFQENHA
jgi:hypothetical protein